MPETYHFKSETTVNHEQDQVDDFAQINHTVQIVSAFDKGNSPSLARYDSDRSLRLTEVVLCETLDERFEQCRLSDSWRSDDSDDDRWWRQSTFIHSLALLAGHLPLLRVSID